MQYGRRVRRTGLVLSIESRGRLVHRLDSRIPLVTALFPITASAPSYAVEPIHSFDSGDEFRHLVSKLSFNAKTQRRAISKEQRSTVHFIGEDRLGMKRIDEVDALVIGIDPVRVMQHLISAVKNDEARFGSQADASQYCGERRPGPTSDAAPTFDAIVASDLRP